MFTYYHLSCLLKFSFGGTLQEYELTEQYLPLNFSVCTVYVQAWNCGILEQNTAFTFPAYLAPAWLLLPSAGVLCGNLETSVSGNGK